MKLAALTGLFACAWAAGCATTEAEFRQGSATAANVRVLWSEQVQDECHRTQGLALMHGRTITGCAVVAAGTCNSVATRPADFRDETRLVALGHELLHCLGWQHR